MEESRGEMEREAGEGAHRRGVEEWGDGSVQGTPLYGVPGHPDMVQTSYDGGERVGERSHTVELRPGLAISSLQAADSPEGYYHPLNLFRRAIQRSNRSFSRCQTRLLDSLFSEYDDMSAVPYLRTVLEQDSRVGLGSFEELLRALAVGQGVRPTDPETLQRISPQQVTVEMQHRRDNCPICQEPFRSHEFFKGLPCTHFFHCDCIEPWLHVKNSCPVCRLPVH